MKRGDSKVMPVINGCVEGVPVTIYLDSGSQATIVNVNIIPKDVLKSCFKVNTKDKLFAISGHVLPSSGCFELQFQVAGKCFMVEAWISSKLSGVPADIVAGQDCLAALGAKLDFKDGFLAVGRVKLPFLDKKGEVERTMGTVKRDKGPRTQDETSHIEPRKKSDTGQRKEGQWDKKKPQWQGRNPLKAAQRGRDGGHECQRTIKREGGKKAPPPSRVNGRSAKAARGKAKAHPRGINDSRSRETILKGNGELNKEKSRVCIPVRTNRAEVVPPRCERVVWSDAPFTDGTELLFEPVGLGMPDLVGAAVIVEVRQGKIPIRLMNLSRSEMRLSKGQVLGQVQYWQQLGVIPVGTTQKTSLIPKMTREEFISFFDLSGVCTTVKPRLVDTLSEFRDVFKLPGQRLGNTPLIKHVIETGGQAPIAQRPYRIPQSRRQALKAEIDTMLDEGIIRPSVSPWASPVVIVEKKDGSLRFCCDYRRLNSVSQFDPYPLPLISETLDALGNAKHFSSLDLASGYWQVPLDEKSIAKSAFVIPGGKYEWTRMPFGLAGSPSTFQRLMDVLLSGLLYEVCLVYLDDIIIYSSTVEEHLERLKLVLNKLREANLKLKPSKCKFFRKELKYLGHVVSRDGMAMDPEKLRAVKDYPRPQNVKDVRAFLGLTGFYRRFIDRYADKAKALTQLQKKGIEFKWTLEADAAFQELKKALVTGPILKYPDFNRPFLVATDASNVGIGSVLAQVHNGQEFPVSYNSRQLSSAEQNYSAIERELLAVVHAVRVYRPYLYGRKFTLITDHRPLKWLMSLKDPSSRLARWSVLLQDYQYEVIHRPGRKNSNVDALSRIKLPEIGEEIQLEREEANYLGAVRKTTKGGEDEPNESELFTPWYDQQRISEEQRRDPKLREIIDKLEKDYPTEDEGMPAEEYRLIEGLLYRVTTNANGRLIEQLVIPSSMTRYVIRLNHEPPISGHLGVNKTLGRLQTQFYWQGMANDVATYVKKCRSCQERKSPMNKKVAPLRPNNWAQRPFEMVSMDILGPLPTTIMGNRYLLVFTDYFTRWVEVIPLPDQKAETIAREFVTQILLRHGVPTKLLTDCGSNFLSKLMGSVYSYFGIRKLATTPYHPEGNGLVERFNRTLADMMSHYTEDQRDWDEFVPFVIFAYRSAPHESTGESPFYLMYGRDANLPFDDILKPMQVNYALGENYKEEMAARLHKAFAKARQNLMKAAEKRKYYYDQKAASTDIGVGDLVLIHFPKVKPGRVAKLARKWIGPYRVLNQTSPVNFEVSKVGSTKTEIVHVNRMKRFFSEGYPYEDVTYDEEEDKQYAPLFPRERSDNFQESQETKEAPVHGPEATSPQPLEAKEEPISPNAEEESEREGMSALPITPPPLPPRQSELLTPPRPAPGYSLRSKGPVGEIDWVMPPPMRRREAEEKQDATKPTHTVTVRRSTTRTEPMLMDKLIWLVQALER